MADSIELEMRLNRAGDAYDMRKILGTRDAIGPQRGATLTAETLRRHFQAMALIKPHALTRGHTPRKWAAVDTNISHAPADEAVLVEIRSMKNLKGSGEDGLSVEMIWFASRAAQ